MREIFENAAIGTMGLHNRLMRSATWEGMCAEDGRPTERLMDYYAALARGGVGLIISGYAYVSPEGKQMHGKMGIHDDSLLPELKKLCEAVHGAGGNLCIQLVHAGGQSAREASGRQPIAPSEVETEQYGKSVPREMSTDDIKRVAHDFGQAARRAKEAGADAVQLHAAHGYLISQFLSPLTNRREDDYGGTIENRARFMMDCIRSVRQAVGDDYPVLVKLNGADNLDGGLELKDAAIAARMLSEGGVDMIEVSGGTPASGAGAPVRTKIKEASQEAYNLALAREIKAAVSCPVGAVGGFRSYEVVESAIHDVLDYVSISRPLIREPNLPKRWKAGDHSRATCISCNKCFIAGLKEGGIYCKVDKEKK